MAITFGFLAFPAFSAEPGLQLELLWSIENVFGMPESAVFDSAREVIYVSNVNEFARDGNGYISRISADGTHTDLKWLTGIHSPTGLAIFANNLYFADYDALVVVDLETSEITGRYPAPDAAEEPSLNDVAVAPDGSVYISGSRSKTIYRWQGGALKTWVIDPQLLQHANGLLVDGDKLIHGGSYWNAFDLESGAVVDPPVKPPPSLVEFDGISSDGRNGFFVTLIDDARIWHIGAGGDTVPLSELELDGIDLDFVSESGLLYVPRVGGSLSVFRVSTNNPAH